MGGVDPPGLGERAEDVPLNVNLPLFEPTYTVSQLCSEVKSFLNEAFGSVWVAGEAQRVRPSQRGHLYFELVEKGEADEIVGKVEAVIWKNDLARVKRLLAGSDQQLAEGMQLRCRGGSTSTAPRGEPSSASARSIRSSPWGSSNGGGGRPWRPSPPPASSKETAPWPSPTSRCGSPSSPPRGAPPTTIS